MPNVAMIVSNPCDPDPRVEKEAFSLIQAGYEVTIYSFDREGNSELVSTNNGIKIRRFRVGFTPTGASSLSMAAKVLFGLKKFRKRVLNDLLKNPPDIIHCHDADTLEIGIMMKSKTNAKLVFDMHDLAHTWARMERPTSIIRIIVSKFIERRLVQRMKKCDLIITSSGAVSKTSYPGFREWVRSRITDPNIIVVENRPIKTKEIEPLPDEFTIGYAGKIREKSMFKTLIKTIENWPEEKTPKIIIAGDGTADSEVENLFFSSDIKVERIGKFSRMELPSIINRMSVMYAVYPTLRGNILDGALPTKMFDAAIYGRPSIVNSGCLMEDISKAEKLGVAINVDDSEALKNALMEIKSQKMMVKLERNWEGESKRLVLAYKDLIVSYRAEELNYS